MLYIQLVFLVLFIVFNVQGYKIKPRIVAGIVAKPGQFPYVVAISYYMTQPFCGGTIISETHVLTAAHCLFMNETAVPATALRVIAGRNRMGHQSTEGVVMRVKRIIIHDKYEYSGDDIAILEMERAFPINNTTISIIPIRKMPVQANARCTVAGWGVQNFTSNVSSEYLRSVNVTVVAFRKCSKMYAKGNYTLPLSLICAGDHRGDSCQGDSGGPLVCAGSVTGIVSGGFGCAEKDFPGLYTNVSKYGSWINATISGSQNKSQNNFENSISISRYGNNTENSFGVYSSTSKILKNVPLTLVFLYIGLCIK